MSLRKGKAALLGEEASLHSLLTDVLGELGVELLPMGECVGADVVLAPLWRIVRAATGRPHERGVPLVALLPFSDERLHASAMRLGARSTYAMGTPLALLRMCVLDALDGPPPSDSEDSVG